MRLKDSAPWLAVAVALAGCGPRPLARNDGHIVQPEPPATISAPSIPQPVMTAPLPPPPEAREAEIRYSVVVANQPVRDVLLAMARETRVNFDIHPGIEGSVNLNAIDQTLKQILTRMSKQVDMRWEADGQTITVMPDTPYLRNYRIDYVNMSRDVTGTIGVQSQVIAPPSATSGGVASTSQNSSLLKVDNTARNRFWETLERNLKDLLRETDKLLPEGSSETYVRGAAQQNALSPRRQQAQSAAQVQGYTQSPMPPGTPATVAPTTQQAEFLEQRMTFREAASVIVNPEAGIITVRATSRQQEKVAEFLAQVIGSARRQVLIEATVVEVRLNDRYQTGVDWSALGLNGLGYSFRQNFLTGDLNNPTNPFFSIQYTNPAAAIGGSISSTIKLLDTFGNTRVLSSPKIMAVNNQTAILKVVDNLVYFTVQAQVTPGTNNSAAIVAYTTTQNVVPVGFVMNVTPQIADNDMVVLNVRPTVSSKIGDVIDPNPDLARVNVQNKVPVIRSREFESVLRIPSGSTAILGGLMEDSFEGTRGGIPVLSQIPGLRELVSYRDDTTSKRELVIFLRPIVVREASLDGDLADYKRYLPSDAFFHDPRLLGPQFDQGIERIESGTWPATVKPVPVVPDPPTPPGVRP